MFQFIRLHTKIWLELNLCALDLIKLMDLLEFELDIQYFDGTRYLVLFGNETYDYI